MGNRADPALKISRPPGSRPLCPLVGENVIDAGSVICVAQSHDDDAVVATSRIKRTMTQGKGVPRSASGRFLHIGVTTGTGRTEGELTRTQEVV
ncbi:hypothetical protein ZHAS_00009369 [Anopheles sinensis]|uniref:Uncharacterized protein n=1 Tax=Anopheles sinensis TaxID=74873 RepID=A0A084VUU3_ANOSI|nr:hypothetical protein ZHAS_00009369 [Anopheles sinensis]